MINKTIIKTRHLYLGGSDTAVYGLNFFKTPYQLWEEKVGIKLYEEISNPNIDFGNKAEKIMSDYVKHLYKDYLYSPDSQIKGIFRVNADGLDKNTVIEFKTSKISNKMRYSRSVPINYWLQVQRYMQIFGREKAHVWFYFATPKQIENCEVSKISFEKMVLKKVVKNEEALVIMDNLAIEFWNYVRTKEPPINYLIDNEKKIKKLEEIYEMDIFEKLEIKDLKKEYRPFKSIIVYGQSGTGKTTFATRDGNAFVLDINEHGAGVATSGHVVEVKNWEHLRTVIKSIKEIKEEIKFDTFVIETLGKLRDIALATVMAENGHKKAQIQDYGDAAKMIKDMIEFLIKVQEKYQFHIVLTGHEAINNNTDVNGATINPKVSIDVQSAIQSAVTTSVDIIAHALISKSVQENNEVVHKYLIDITPSELYVTKARTKNNVILEQTLIENASVSKLVKLVETGKVSE